MIHVDQLYKYYGRHRAVGPLSFSIDQGEIAGLVGLNGAGKTTALRILACDLLPSCGSVIVNGCDVVDSPQLVRKLIGYLPDHPPLYPEMTVRAYLVFVARLRGASSVEIASSQAEKAEKLCQLDHVAQTPIFSLSHGYKQRVGIAQAIVHQPRLVLLDEPILGLDPVQIVEMRYLLRSLAGDFTIVLSSHNLHEISETCDKLLVLKQGEIVASGSEKDLLSHWIRGLRAICTIRGDLQKACNAIVQLNAVKEVIPVVLSDISPCEDDCHAIEIHAESDIRAEIVRTLVAHDIDVIGLTKASRELESMFIHLANSPLSSASQLSVIQTGNLSSHFSSSSSNPSLMKASAEVTKEQTDA